MRVCRVDDLIAAKLGLASAGAVDDLEPVPVTVRLDRPHALVATNIDVRAPVERSAQHLEERLELYGVLHRAHRVDDVLRVGEGGVLLARQRAGDLARRREPPPAPPDTAGGGGDRRPAGA